MSGDGHVIIMSDMRERERVRDERRTATSEKIGNTIKSQDDVMTVELEPVQPGDELNLNKSIICPSRPSFLEGSSMK